MTTIQSKARPFYINMRAVSKRRTEVNTDIDPYHVEHTGLLFDVKPDITVSLHLKNIFNRNYEEEYGYPMAGRTILAGFDWRLNKSSGK